MAVVHIAPGTFDAAACGFSAVAKSRAADLIGLSHELFFRRGQMSAQHKANCIEEIRECMQILNAEFAVLERAHSTATMGEIASRIRTAAER